MRKQRLLEVRTHQTPLRLSSWARDLCSLTGPHPRKSHTWFNVLLSLSRSLHVVHLSGFFPHSRLVSAAVCIFMCLSESVCQIPHRFLLAFGWDFTDFVDESGVNLIIFTIWAYPSVYIFFSFPWEYFVVVYTSFVRFLEIHFSF